jgi:hypothetical protein
VACYFTDDSQAGWVDLINRVLHPEAGDFPAGVNPPSVLTASWAIAPGDDPDGLTYADTYWGTGVTINSLQAMTAAFQDAAILQTGPTICICTGDYGSNQGVGRYAGYGNYDYDFDDRGYGGGGRCSDLRFDSRSFSGFDWSLRRPHNRRLVLPESHGCHCDYGHGTGAG